MKRAITLVPFLSVVLLASGAGADPHLAQEQRSKAAYHEVRRLIADASFFGVDPAGVKVIEHRLQPGWIRRGISYRAATDALVGVLRRRDRWAFVEEAAEQQAGVAPASNNITGHRLPGNVGMIKIRGFRGEVGEVGERVRSVIEGMRSAGPLSGIVIDLRGNRGGRIVDAVDLASQFLPPASHLYDLHYAPASGGDEVKSHATHADARPDLDTRMAILVDGNTVSTSELVARVFAEHGRARLFGAPTYGKGIGQRTWDLPDGRSFQQTILAVSVPKAGFYHGVPLVPDETVAEAATRIAGDGRVRLRGDVALRGALVYLSSTSAKTP